MRSKKPAVVVMPLEVPPVEVTPVEVPPVKVPAVKVPPSRILTLSEQQLASLDWQTPRRPGPYVKDKRVVAGPGVEFDIYFPSNTPGNRSLNFVSSGEGGTGTMVGADISGYEEFALKMTVVSINGQSGPDLKQKLVAGALIGPTTTRQVSTYEPVTLGLAASDKTAIAKTSGLADRIYQIGFHVHMLNPQDWDPSGSVLTLQVGPVEDGQVSSAPPVVSVSTTPSVTPSPAPRAALNRYPVADSNSVTTMEDTPVEINLTGSDPDSDPLTYSMVAGLSHGSLSGTAPNLTYKPNANFNGSDSFTFKVNDGITDSTLATISITVLPVNDPPIANSDTAVTREDTPTAAIDVLANDTDVDNDKLTVAAVSQGANGSVTINPNSTLTYSPRANFHGSDVFTYTVSDGKSQTDTAKVDVTVNMVNDAPVITSAPVITATASALYIYDVDATDPDAGDTLTYSLTTKPAGMTINSATGLLQWKPTDAQGGTNEAVVVKVADSNSIPASDTQSFTITVNPAPLKITTLTVSDGYNQRDGRTLSADGKTGIVQSSDDNWWETSFGSYTSYEFSNVSIPAGAVITSVAVYVEHFEEERFGQGKLEWAIGTGWPTKPVVWASINAPVYEGQTHEAVDSWDVASFVDTAEKINSLQLQIKNNDNVARRKTFVDYIYVVVKYLKLDKSQ